MAGTASAVAAVLFLCSAADATQPTLRDVERRRASAETDKRRLESDSRATAQAVDDLNRKLVAAAMARRAAETSVADLERQVGRLLENERAAQADVARSTAAFEHALVALSRADLSDRRSRQAPRQPSRQQSRQRPSQPLSQPLSPSLSQPADQPAAAAVAAVAGRALAQNAMAASQRAESVAAQRRELADRRAALAVAQARLDSKTAEIRDLLAQQQARQAILNADAGRAGARVTALALQARTLRDLVSRTAARRPEATRASSVSRTSLTRLTPVAGQVVGRFGDRLPVGAAQGLTLRTRAGEQVLAPAAGRVAYSGPFRSYGIVLILDLDNDYAVVLTGMDAILANVGQRVLAGQPIAEMTADATLAPELYVEVRHNGSPIDPARWLSAAR